MSWTLPLAWWQNPHFRAQREQIERAEPVPKPNSDNYPEDQSFFPDLFFSFITFILDQGNDRKLTAEDFHPLSQEDNVFALHKKFDQIWQAGRKDNRGLFYSCLYFTWYWVFRNGFFLLLNNVCEFGFPYGIDKLLDWLAKPYADFTDGILYLSILVLSSGFANIFLGQYYWGITRAGIHIQTALQAQLFNKAIKLSNKSRSKYADGEIINLSSVDCVKIEPFPDSFNLFGSAIIMTVVSLGFLWRILGWSIVAGLIAFLLLIPVEFLVAKKITEMQEELMTRKDKRMKAVNEAIHAVQVIKFFVWEDNILQKITEARNSEIDMLMWLKILEGVNDQIMDHFAPTLIMISTYVTYLLLGNPLTASIVFTSLSLFKILRGWLMWIPYSFNLGLEIWISMGRIEAFLNADELDRYQINVPPPQKNIDDAGTITAYELMPEEPTATSDFSDFGESHNSYISLEGDNRIGTIESKVESIGKYSFPFHPHLLGLFFPVVW